MEDQLKIGMKEEEEHKNLYKKIKEYFDNGKLIPYNEFLKMIAKKHIDEKSNYYEELKKLEKSLRILKANGKL